MKKLTTLMLSSAALLVLSGCNPQQDTEPMAANEEARSVLMQCGEQRITGEFAGEKATITLADTTYELQQVKSADGARYQVADDESTEFWSKGDTAQLTVEGKAYPECTSAPEALLMGSEWQLIELDGKKTEVVAQGEATEEEAAVGSLNFGDDGRVYGRAFCNNFTGSYQLQGDKLAISEVASTMMMCDEAAMKQEQTMLDILGNSEQLALTTEGNLVITTTDGRALTAN